MSFSFQQGKRECYKLIQISSFITNDLAALRNFWLGGGMTVKTVRRSQLGAAGRTDAIVKRQIVPEKNGW